MNPTDIIKQSTEGASKIKLPGGLVGKTCYVLMAAAGSLAVMVASIRTEAVGFVAIGTLFVLVLVVVLRLIHFAEKRPEVAILEGAEFLRYQQFELARKGVGVLPSSPPESPDSTEKLPSPHDIEVAMLPDPEPTANDAGSVSRTNKLKD